MRPLTTEPLPLDLLNTTWFDAGVHDLLADAEGVTAWLAEHGLEGPCDAPARRALVQTRHVLRAWLAARDDDQARGWVNTILRRGAERPLLPPRRMDGVWPHPYAEVQAAAAWELPWRCARDLVVLEAERGERIRRCANPACVLWFLDTTRPGTRRWCSMAACGNHAKAVRHGRVRSPSSSR